MNSDEIREALARTLDDRRMSRGERRTLGALLEDLPANWDRRELRRLAFAMASEATVDPVAHAVLGWVEDVVKLLDPERSAPAELVASEAHFSPGSACPRRIAGLLGSALRRVEICVFTITDDRITGAILDAHGRGVAVRIVTDDDKAMDLGSDIERLIGAGVPLRKDRSPFHMHHKFALFDGIRLATGSFNWTRGASENNEENLIVTGDEALVAAFSERFESLWDLLG